MGKRSTSFPLFRAVALAVLPAFAMVWAVKFGLAGEWQDHWLWPAGLFAATLAGVRLLLAAFRFRGDQPLLVLGFLLAGLGTAVQSRFGTMAFDDPSRLSTWALPLGAAAMVGVVAVFGGERARWLKSFATPAAVLALAVLAAMALAGRRFRGALYVGDHLNPSEVIKVLMVLYAARLLSDYREAFAKPSFPGVPRLTSGLLLSLAAFWLVPMALLVVIRDLGLMVLLNAVLAIMAALATGRLGYLMAGVAAVAAGTMGAWLFAPHAAARIRVWLDPFSDPTGGGWQILQGLSAMASGGWWGAGLGAGHPVAVPIAASDFVYAAVGEELGYVGCGLTLAAYLALFYRGYRLADRCADPFLQALANGVTSMLALQTFLHVGGVTKAVPLTGLTLPFVSHGGSSLVTSFVLLGIQLALSDRRVAGRVREDRRRSRF